MGEIVEKRRQPRREIRWPVTILADHGTVEGETRNITGEGVFISCDEPLRLNEVFRMSVLPPDHSAIGVLGKVIWSDVYGLGEDESAYGMGVCLVKISTKDREFLEQMVAQGPEA